MTRYVQSGGGVRRMAWIGERVTLQDLRDGLFGDDELGCVGVGISVARDDEGDGGGDLGAQSSTDDGRLAGVLFRGVKEETDTGLRRAMGGAEGVYGDVVGGVDEDRVGKGAEGELGTDVGGHVAEGEGSGGVVGVKKASTIEKVWVGPDLARPVGMFSLGVQEAGHASHWTSLGSISRVCARAGRLARLRVARRGPSAGPR